MDYSRESADFGKRMTRMREESSVTSNKKLIYSASN